MPNSHPTFRTFGLCLVSFAAIAVQPSARAADPGDPAHCWAVLIGVSQYEKAAKLPYIDNDVNALDGVLQQYGGYQADKIRKVYSGSADFKPTKSDIEGALKIWLRKPAEGDTIIVYFSGHGFRDKDGKLYLAPQECDPANPTAAGIPVEWVRQQLDACPTALKLLILDACHAGAEKGDDKSPSVTAKELGEEFKQSAGVVTLASSTADQKSQIWDFKQQSLFSYWLKEALKGHADENGDGDVDIDELYKYLENHVTATAKVRLDRPQTPVRIVGPKTLGVPVVLRLHPQGLKQTLSDMAEQLAGALEERRVAKVGVLEFANDTKLGEVLGGNFGLLGKYCGDELERHLSSLGTGKFSVIDRARLLPALQQQQFALKDFSNTAKLTAVAKSVGGLPTIARGTLRDRKGRVVTLRCRLEETEDGARLSDVGGLALLTESEWAMVGRSASIKPDDKRPDPPTVAVSVTAPPAVPADDRARKTHPLQDPAFPYPLRFLINGKIQPLVFKKVGEGDDERVECFLGVKKDDIVEIQVQSRDSENKKFCMRLLIDGLNTLPEREDTKGITTWIMAKRVNLEDARAWVLDPADSQNAKYPPNSTSPSPGGLPTWGIRGFVSETGQQGQLKEFKIVDADESLAARQRFTDQIGIITAAFYAEGKDGSRGPSLGFGTGKTKIENLTEKPAVIGRLKDVVHVRYVDAKTLADP